METVIGDLLLDSLQRRMATMHSLYYQAVASMELEHVNHFEREGVLPIAFSLFHYTNMEDACFMLITGIAPIWNDEWQARVQMSHPLSPWPHLSAPSSCSWTGTPSS